MPSSVVLRKDYIREGARRQAVMVIERRKTARFAASQSMSNPVNRDLCTTIIPKPVIPNAASGARNPRGCFQRWFPMHPLPRRADRGRQNEIATMIRFLPSCHWYENDRHNLQIVIPAKERHPVPRYGAGIQSPVPANTRLSTKRLSPFSSSMVPVATGMANCYENRPRQTRRRGNPCGCPFPAPTRFHPLMWPSQCHGHSEKRSDEESTISPPPTERLPIPISPPNGGETQRGGSSQFNSRRLNSYNCTSLVPLKPCERYTSRRSSSLTRA